MGRHLRTGYTTGSCASAAAKAAVLALVENKTISEVQISLPDLSRHSFKTYQTYLDSNISYASVVKDSGDDPDVTNGAEIFVKASFLDDVKEAERNPHFLITNTKTTILLSADSGVGIVTKPGLAVPVGRPAINPVPQDMIGKAVLEVLQTAKYDKLIVHLAVGVVDGHQLAKKTLNYKLGIEGGLSVLGTTGIVKPVSAEAWTATITASMNVAKAMGIDEVVLCSGRTSELVHLRECRLPQEAYIMMGDYVEYAVKDAVRHGFKKITLCAQWAKMLKIAMAIPHTHVRYGPINVQKAIAFISRFCKNEIPSGLQFNTARELFDWLILTADYEAITSVVRQASDYVSTLAHQHVYCCLVTHEGKLIS